MPNARSCFGGAFSLAADLVNLPVSDFVRSAAKTGQRKSGGHESQTQLPAAFYDSLLAALDEPARPSPALRRASSRTRDVVTR